MPRVVEEITKRYERGARLGSGAMGEVWLVRDRESGRAVAMKTLHWPASESARRFENEVSLQSRLSHRAVPRVLDRGVDAEGMPWFTMERIEGRTLATLLDDLRAHHERGARPIDRTWLLRLFVRVCRVVEHAHRRGVVHRDLKPENVMIDANGDVHLIDWGLAEIAGTKPEPRRGVVVGTPGYIAPELARGDGFTALASGDVFALGAILFELVELEPLYPQAHPLARLTAVLLDGDPLVGRGSHELFTTLERVIRCAIAREPSARFASAESLALAVELALAPSRRMTRAYAGLAAAAALGWLALSPAIASASEHEGDPTLVALTCDVPVR